MSRSRKPRLWAPILAGAALLVVQNSANAQTTMRCEELARLELTDMKFGRPVENLVATLVDAGEGMPEHCKVTGRIWPEIDFMIKLPTDWNGDFVMTGNQGMAGQIREHYLTRFVAMGYVSAGDNGGHDTPGFDMGWAAASQPNSDQKLEDLAHRSIHETSNLTRAVIDRYYGADPEYAYFWGTSHGGRQVMRSFQMYPEDFDGWLAGMALANVTGTIMFDTWNQYATSVGEGAIPMSKLRALADAVYAKCDSLDGAVEGLIEDPTSCAFDPAKDLKICSVDDETCFTEAQIAALRRIYDGPMTTAGTSMFVPLVPGAEAFAPPPAGPDGGYGEGPAASMWVGPVVSPKPQDFNGGMAGGYVSNYLRLNGWNPMSGNFDWFVSDEIDAYTQMMDATHDVDLDDVKASGKKIIQWHGWSDVLVPAMQVVEYYNTVMRRYGDDEARSFYRLYMIPGFAHGGGIGPGQADFFEALRAWVEDGKVPGAVIGSRPGLASVGLSPLTRPLCVYPQVARYDGSGDVNEADNFGCVDKH